MRTQRVSTLSLLIFVLGLLGMFVVSGTPRVAAEDKPWRARYWNNRKLQGEPVMKRDEAAPNWDWGDGTPADFIDKDNFSARWTRTTDFATGTYRFTATMDDGMRVWVDDQLIIDSWTDSQVHTVQADRYLQGGAHTIKVEYYEAGGKAVARMSWAKISSTPGVFYGWRGEYFNNRDLAGAPAAYSDDYRVNFDWSINAPISGIFADDFSVRWTRTIDFPKGKYRFDVFSDDGVRLYVNNQLVIDEWRNQSEGRFSKEVELAGGQVPMRLEYFEGKGRAAVSLSWTPNLGTGIPSAGITATAPTGTPTPVTPTIPGGGPAATLTYALYLNVRSGPSIDDEIIDHLKRGQTVALTGYQSPGGYWVEVRLPSGDTGWASARYLTLNVPLSSLKVQYN